MKIGDKFIVDLDDEEVTRELDALATMLLGITSTIKDLTLQRGLMLSRTMELIQDTHPELMAFEFDINHSIGRGIQVKVTRRLFEQPG